MSITLEYTVNDYPSNVEIFVRILEDGKNTGAGGRVAIIGCTSDEPQYQTEEDFEEDSNAMTKGAELGSFLRGLSTEELAEWLHWNGHETGKSR